MRRLTPRARPRKFRYSTRARWVINLTHASSKILFVPYDEAYGEGFEDNVAACA